MALSDSAGVGSALPSQVGVTSGWALTTNGSTAAWAAVSGGSGVTTMAAVGSTPSANAASISGVTLTMQPADGTHPGVVTTAAQTFGGAKTFGTAGSTSITANTILGTIDSDASGHATQVFDTAVIPTTAKLFSWRAAGFEVASCDKSGNWTFLLSANLLAGNVFANGTVTALASGLGTVALDGTGVSGGSIKLKSPNGTTFTLTVSNAGALVIT